VHVTHARITRAALDEPGVSRIGVPLPEMTIHLLGPDGEPVPDGTPGEMHVGGSGVARGYLNRPELTAERFLDAGPGPGGGRRYRSGDRAVRMPDGGYSYLGRTDDQVKVRGFRIEPAEVEATLAAHPKVASAHVTTTDFGDGDVRLLAHLVTRAAHPLTDREISGLTRELLTLARDALPEYMRPSGYRFIDAAPLTANGKADRSAVWRLPYREAPAAPAAGTGPQDAVSQIVAGVLGRPVTALDDDLFDLGVTSLAFVRIITSVNRRFQLTLTGAELDRASIRALAACAEAAAGAATARDEEGRIHHDGDQ
jgi:acyl carrier protein